MRAGQLQGYRGWQPDLTCSPRSRFRTATLSSLTVALAASCQAPLSTPIGHDAAAPQDLRSGSTDSSAAADMATTPDSVQGTEAAPSGRCTSPSVQPPEIPVRGTVHGPRLNGVLCDGRVGTAFFGPNGTAFGSYGQAFSGGYDNLVLDVPADAVTAYLTAGVGTTGPEIGTYDSATTCGYFLLEVRLPIPPGIVCPSEYGPCGPDCAGVGEMVICEPTNPRLRYLARPSASCGSDPPAGGWQMTLTSIAPYSSGYPLIGYLTHGHATATLVNENDPSDAAIVDLDF
jgi:hypothetical protein